MNPLDWLFQYIPASLPKAAAYALATLVGIVIIFLLWVAICMLLDAIRPRDV